MSSGSVCEGRPAGPSPPTAAAGGGATARANQRSMSSGSTRRRFLQASAATAAGVALGDAGALAAQAGRPNILLLVVDSLRTDYVGIYGSRTKTPNIDAIAADGIRFTRVFPEAMPTVPARNSILSGRRVFPFRGWRDRDGLIGQPGWSPLDDVPNALPALLRGAGWWTAYVTDNPFLGYAPPYRRAAKPDPGGPYRPNSRYGDNEERSFAARVFKNATAVREETNRIRP